MSARFGYCSGESICASVLVWIALQMGANPSGGYHASGESDTLVTSVSFVAALLFTPTNIACDHELGDMSLRTCACASLKRNDNGSAPPINRTKLCSLMPFNGTLLSARLIHTTLLSFFCRVSASRFLLRAAALDRRAMTDMMVDSV